VAESAAAGLAQARELAVLLELRARDPGSRGGARGLPGAGRVRGGKPVLDWACGHAPAVAPSVCGRSPRVDSCAQDAAQGGF
jgi:hypothetical protein